MSSKLRKIMKREVVTVQEGRSLGPPEDVLIDPGTHTIAYVVVNYGPVADTTLVVPADAVQSFDTDTLAIDSLDSLVIAARDEKALTTVGRRFAMRKQRVLTNQGANLGKVSSVMINADGKVTEYRVRKGLWGHLKPAQRIDPSRLETPGGEVAVVESQQ